MAGKATHDMISRLLSSKTLESSSSDTPMAGNRPIRALNVAEKPSVAKAVTGILSRNNARMREGRSRYNKIFEFEYTIRGQPIHMIFTSVTGHLMELEFDERFKKWHSCDPADLYQAPVRKSVPQVCHLIISFLCNCLNV